MRRQLPAVNAATPCGSPTPNASSTMPRTPRPAGSPAAMVVIIAGKGEEHINRTAGKLQPWEHNRGGEERGILRVARTPPALTIHLPGVDARDNGHPDYAGVQLEARLVHAIVLYVQSRGEQPGWRVGMRVGGRQPCKPAFCLGKFSPVAAAACSTRCQLPSQPGKGSLGSQKPASMDAVVSESRCISRRKKKQRIS